MDCCYFFNPLLYSDICLHRLLILYELVYDNVSVSVQKWEQQMSHPCLSFTNFLTSFQDRNTGMGEAYDYCFGGRRGGGRPVKAILLSLDSGLCHHLFTASSWPEWPLLLGVCRGGGDSLKQSLWSLWLCAVTDLRMTSPDWSLLEVNLLWLSSHWFQHIIYSTEM